MKPAEKKRNKPMSQCTTTLAPLQFAAGALKLPEPPPHAGGSLILPPPAVLTAHAGCRGVFVPDAMGGGDILNLPWPLKAKLGTCTGGLAIGCPEGVPTLDWPACAEGPVACACSTWAPAHMDAAEGGGAPMAVWQMPGPSRGTSGPKPTDGKEANRAGACLATASGIGAFPSATLTLAPDGGCIGDTYPVGSANGSNAATETPEPLDGRLADIHPTTSEFGALTESTSLATRP